MDVKTAHPDAILALLRLAPPESDPLVVYDGAAAKGATGPYVVARFSTIRPDGTSLTTEQDAAETRAMLICAVASDFLGGEGVGLRIVTARVEAALLGVTPVIAGRSCSPVRDDGDVPADWDDSTGARIWTQRVAYRFFSVPA